MRYTRGSLLQSQDVFSLHLWDTIGRVYIYIYIFFYHGAFFIVTSTNTLKNIYHTTFKNSHKIIVICVYTTNVNIIWTTKWVFGISWCLVQEDDFERWYDKTLQYRHNASLSAKYSELQNSAINPTRVEQMYFLYFIWGVKSEQRVWELSTINFGGYNKFLASLNKLVFIWLKLCNFLHIHQI